MAKIPAAQARLFKNVFICKRCSAKVKADARKIIEGKVKCRACNGKAFRPKRKK
ncbi:50S ribosomal protein L40e [Nanoarchaeota archaeon]